MRTYPEDELELGLAKFAFAVLLLLWILLPALLSGLRVAEPPPRAASDLIHSAYPETPLLSPRRDVPCTTPPPLPVP